MKFAKSMAVAAFAVLAFSSVASEAAILKVRVEATSPIPANDFSYPFFTFRNQSTPGIQVTGVTIGGMTPWDWISSVDVANPAGGSRSLLVGEERPNTDGNNGCTSSIQYGLNGFDANEFFQIAADPEAGGCGSAVVDIRPALQAGTINASASFSNGDTLSGSNWVVELIDPQGNANDSTNQRYFLELSKEIRDVVPASEPATLALLGAGLVGLSALRRRRA